MQCTLPNRVKFIFWNLIFQPIYKLIIFFLEPVSFQTYCNITVSPAVTRQPASPTLRFPNCLLLTHLLRPSNTYRATSESCCLVRFSGWLKAVIPYRSGFSPFCRLARSIALLMTFKKELMACQPLLLNHTWNKIDHRQGNSPNPWSWKQVPTHMYNTHENTYKFQKFRSRAMTKHYSSE